MAEYWTAIIPAFNISVRGQYLRDCSDEFQTSMPSIPN
jgi:hypothetical protein